MPGRTPDPPSNRTETPSASRRRRAYGSGGPELDQRLRGLVEDLGVADPDLAFELLVSAVRLAREPVSRLDRKIANAALKEMRYAFRVFGPYRHIRKVSIFGSARVAPSDPEYATAREFGQMMAARHWMVVTGAGPGIMQAGNEGAGSEASFGVNIALPMEAKPNEFVADNAKLINFKYFFTRKLMFMKESDGFVLFPGGFGTLDEAFELLTLVQTGKSDLNPIVLLEVPGGRYWEGFETYLREHQLTRGFIGEDDLSLFRRCQDPPEAAAELVNFYRVFHSQRYVRSRLILRLNREIGDPLLAELSADFADILDGTIERTGPSDDEVRDDDWPDLPRISLPFDRQHFGRLRHLVDRLNDAG